jgi:two-component system, NtrC family, sensor kinase
MTKGRILVAADTPDSTALLQHLLASAGYEVLIAAIADGSTTPPDADILVADITRTRFSPYVDIQMQRRLGVTAPAMVFAARFTDEMATEAFSLNIREFVLKPIEDQALIDRVGKFLAAMRKEDYKQIEQSAAPASAPEPEPEAPSKPVINDTQTNRRLEEMHMLSRIGRAIAALSDLDKMLAHVVDAATFLTKAEEGAIFLLDDRGVLVLGAEKGFGAKQAEVIKRPSQDSDAMEVVRTGTPIMRGADTEHKLITGFLVRALVNTPIIIGKQTVGVLAVYNHGQRSFEERDVALMINLADYAAMAIDKVRSLQRVQNEMRDAIAASREVVLHSETLIAPVQGIESLTDTLLQGDFGALNEQQYTAVRRIKMATARLNEVVEFINQAAAGAASLRAK